MTAVSAQAVQGSACGNVWRGLASFVLGAAMLAGAAQADELAIYAGPPDSTSTALTELDVSADSILVLYAGTVDSTGVFVARIDASWALSAPLGSLFPEFASLAVLNPTTAGSGYVQVSAAGHATLEVPISVRPGGLAELRIVKTRLASPALGDTTLVLGSTLRLWATGFDAYGNKRSTAPVVGWSATGGAGSLSAGLDSTTTFNATAPGTGRVAASSGGITASTGLLQVVPGPLARIRVSQAANQYVPVTAATLTADQSRDLYALGEDATGYLLGAVSASWTSRAPLSLVPSAASGTSVEVSAARIGAGRIVARLGAFADSTAVLTVVPGVTSRLRIEDSAAGSGSVVGARTLSADATLALHAVGRDADGNFTGAQSATWGMTSPVGTFSVASGSSTVLDATTPGTATITAQAGALLGSGGPVTVTAGVPHHLQIETASGAEVGAQVMSPGSTFTAYAGLRDANNNRLGRAPATWSWLGTVLAPAPSAADSVFAWVATAVGTGRLVIQRAGVAADTSATLTVTLGVISRVEIRSAPNGGGTVVTTGTFAAGSAVNLFAAAYDLGGNYLGDVPVTWGVVPLGGSAQVSPLVGSSTIVTPQSAGNVRVVAVHASGPSYSTGSLTIVPGALSVVRVETLASGAGSVVGAVSLGAGGTLALHAIGRDAWGNFVGTQSVSWLVRGGIGQVAPVSGGSTLFTAQTAGSGSIDIVHASVSTTGTGTITVSPGAASGLVIEATPGDPLDPIGARVITVDDSLQAFAVARDAFGNLVQAAAATWSVTGGAAVPSASGPSLSTWLRPQGLGTVVLRATWSGLTATTGNIEIRAGAPTGAFLIAATPGTLRADGVSQAQLVFGPVRDRLGNLVADGTPLLVTATAGGLLKADGDLATPGVQIGLVSGTASAVLVAPSAPASVRVDATSASAAAQRIVQVLPTVDVRVVTGSLTPGDVARGDTLALVFRVRNHEAGVLHIDTATLEFADGNDGLFSAPLAAAVSVPASAESELRFASRVLPAAMDVGAYAPVATLAGRDAFGNAWSRVLVLGTSSLRVSAVQLLAVRAGSARVARSDTLDVFVDVHVAGAALALDAARTGLSFSGAENWSWWLVQPADGALLPPNTTTVLRFAARPAANAALGASSIDAHVAARGSDGLLIAAGADARGSVEIIGGATPRFVSRTPAVVTRGTSAVFRVAVANDGDAQVVLQAATTMLRAGADLAAPLDPNGDGVLEPGQTSTLVFTSAVWPADSTPGQKALTLELRGSQEGAAFAQTIAADSVLVQTPALLQGVAGTLDPNPAAGTNVNLVEVGVRNAGQSTLQLDTASRLRIADRQAVLASPATLAADQTATLLFNGLDLTGLPPGSYAVTIEGRGTQNGAAFSQDLVHGDAMSVTAPAALSILAVQPSQARVTAGQTAAWTIDAQLRNNGGTTAVLDSVRVRFQRAASNVTSEYQITLPTQFTSGSTTLAPASTGTLRVSIPRTGTTTGDVRVDVFVELRDGLSGEPIELATTDGGAAAIRVETPPVPTLVAFAPSRSDLAAGQAAPLGTWSANLVVRNAGSADAIATALLIDAFVDGVARTSEYTFTPSTRFVSRGDSLLAGGATDTLRVVVTRTGTTTGMLTLRARLQSHDALNGAELTDRTLDATALPVRAPAVLVVRAPRASEAAVLTGSQQAWTVDATVRNAGGAALRIDAVQLGLRQGGIDRTSMFTLQSPPAGAVLAAGDSTTLRFSVTQTAALTGDLTLRAQASGTEVASGRALSLFTDASGPVLQTPADLRFDGLQPARVTQNAVVSLRPTFTNIGGATAVLDTTTALVFAGTRATLPAPLSLAPGASATLALRSVRISPSAPLGAVVVTFEARGRHANEVLSRNVAAGSLVIDEPADVAIQQAVASQPRLTAGQAAPWSVDVTIANNGGVAAILDSVQVRLQRAADDVTAQYTFGLPTTFLNASARLASAATGTLRIPFTRTGTTTGDVRIDVFVRLHEEGSGNSLGWVSTEAGGAAAVRIETPAQPVMLAFTPERSDVVGGQTQTWAARLLLRNAGGADVRLDSLAVEAWTNAVRRTDYAITRPTVFSGSRDAFLRGGVTDTLRILVTRTGSTAGELSLRARVHGRDALNGSGLGVLQFDSQPVTVLRPAVLRATTFVPSRPRAISGTTQPWSLSLDLFNDGEAGVDVSDLALDLHVDGAKRTADFTLTLPVLAELPGGTSTRLVFEVTQTPVAQGAITATLDVAASEQGSLRTLGLAASGAGPVLDAPADLRVLASGPSRISRGAPIDPWVILYNAGGATARLDTTTALCFDAVRASLQSAPAIAAQETLYAAMHTVPVPADQELGPALLRLDVRGQQNDEPLALDLAAGSLEVEEAAAIVIHSLTSSQPTVTRGQSQAWEVALAVGVSRSARYRWDEVDLQFFVDGVNETAAFEFSLLDAIGETSPPRTASQDTLRFRVDRTLDRRGVLTLEAHLRGTDLDNGTELDADTQRGGRGSLRIQDPAQPELLAFTLSQPAVTTQQQRAIEAVLHLRNAGEAALDVSAAIADLVSLPAGIDVATLLEGGPRLVAGAEAQLRYTLTRFDVNSGTLTLRAEPALREPNRGVAMPFATEAVLQVQAPASVRLRDAAVPAAVTVLQAAPWFVSFDVDNLGGSRVRLAELELAFERDGNDAAAGFDVSVPSQFESGQPLELAGGETGTLRFTITHTDSVAGAVQLQLRARGEELNSGRLLDVRGETFDVTLQTPPVLVAVDSTLSPHAASRGQAVQLALDVTNTGQASLGLDPLRSRIRIPGTTYAAPLASATHVAGLGSARLVFAEVELPGEAEIGERALLLELGGTENGNDWSASLVPGESLRVDAAAAFEVLDVQPSQDRLTRAQQRDWTVRVDVRNGGAAARLESARLAFTLGTLDVSGQFGVVAPVAFESGSTELPTGETQALLFHVQATADLQGLIVLDAILQVRDLNSNEVRDTQSLGTSRGSVRLDAPAAPRVVRVQPSQPTVSAGQAGDWDVEIEVRNEGGSRWTPDWSSAALRIGASDDSTRAPLAFAAGPATLDAGESGTATFTVLRTGSETGHLGITASLSGIQESDATPSPAAAGTAAIDAVLGAALVIDGIVADLPRAPLANTGQRVPLAISVRNAGQSALRDALLELRVTGASPTDTTFSLALAGGAELQLAHALDLAATSGTSHVVVRAVRAVDVNDSTRTAAWTGSTPAAWLDLQAQDPAVLRVAAVQPSQARVSAGQTSDWWITVTVANDGDEAMVLRAPRASDIVFRRDGLPQPDYTLVPPEQLVEGGLEIAGRDSGTLVYRVSRTGASGGHIDLETTLVATHTNDLAAAAQTARGSTAVDVDDRPGLRIIAVDAMTWRRDRGFDDFRVNLGQRFGVRVTIANTGGTPLDSVRVQLDMQRGASRIESNVAIVTIDPTLQTTVDFDVVAGDLVSRVGEPEVFVARIVYARDRNSGVRVFPEPAVQNTTFAFVEARADLELVTWIESPVGARDGSVSTHQEFVLAARVDNRGDADVSETGRLQVHAPAGFDLQDPEQLVFRAGEMLSWRLRAPGVAASAESLRVAVTEWPLDQNDGNPAPVEPGDAAVGVSVFVPPMLECDVAIVEPAGAVDRQVSRGQSLVIEARIRGGATLVERGVELQLPEAWTFASGYAPHAEFAAAPEAIVRWSVVAGGAGDATLRTDVAAVDPNTDAAFAANAALLVTTRTPATLELDAAIVSPAEALDHRLLPGQRFTVRTHVQNRGEAGVAAATPGAAHGRVRVSGVTPGFTIDATEAEFTLDASGGATLDWNLRAPLVFSSALTTLRFAFAVVPLDENSITPVPVHDEAAALTVSLANDALDGEVTYPPLGPIAPGQTDLELARFTLANATGSAAALDSLALFVHGGRAADLLARVRVVRDGVTLLEVTPTPGNPSRLGFPPSLQSAVVAAAGSAAFKVLADVAPVMPAETFSIQLRDPQRGTPLVRVVEAGSRTPLALRWQEGAATSIRVVPVQVAAYNAPNPFRPGAETTSIYYHHAGDASVAVQIYTLQGGLVWQRSFAAQADAPVLSSVEWDGRNGVGHPVRNGVYVCRVSVNGQTTQFKIAVAR